MVVVSQNGPGLRQDHSLRLRAEGRVPQCIEAFAVAWIQAWVQEAFTKPFKSFSGVVA